MLSKKYLSVLAFLLIINLSLFLVYTQGETEKVDFDPKKISTWASNWDKLKAKLDKDLLGTNNIWTGAKPEERETTLNNLIKQNYGDLTTKNLGSKKLKFAEGGIITNGETFFDPQKLPPNLKKFEYSEKENGFIYKFEDTSSVTIRKGTLNKDLIIKGTDWPSDGLKWNGKGTFHQTEEGVTIDKGSKIKVGVMEVSQAKPGSPSSVSFRKGDEGKNYVKGMNIQVLVKDFAKVTTPIGIQTEVFIGNIKPDSNQYVNLGIEGKNIKIKGNDITVEILKDLKTAEADGNNIRVESKGTYYRTEKINGVMQTKTNHKPGDSHNFNFTNIQNPVKGSAIIETPNENPNSKISGNGRIRYTQVGKPGGIISSRKYPFLGRYEISNTKFYLGSSTTNQQLTKEEFYKSLGKGLNRNEFYVKLTKTPKVIDITFLLDSSLKTIKKADIVEDFDISSRNFQKNDRDYYQSDTDNINSLLNTRGVLINKYPKGTRTIISTGSGSTNPIIRIYNPQGQEQNSFQITNPNYISSLRKYINYQIAAPNKNIPFNSYLNQWYEEYKKYRR